MPMDQVPMPANTPIPRRVELRSRLVEADGRATEGWLNGSDFTPDPRPAFGGAWPTPDPAGDLQRQLAAVTAERDDFAAQAAALAGQLEAAQGQIADLEQEASTLLLEVRELFHNPRGRSGAEAARLEDAIGKWIREWSTSGAGGGS